MTVYTYGCFNWLILQIFIVFFNSMFVLVFSCFFKIVWLSSVVSFGLFSLNGFLCSLGSYFSLFLLVLLHNYCVSFYLFLMFILMLCNIYLFSLHTFICFFDFNSSSRLFQFVRVIKSLVLLRRENLNMMCAKYNCLEIF
jgi:hypothetical protein